MGYPTNDDQWEEKVLTEVTDWGDQGWEFKFDYLCLGAPNGPITPEPGMTVRLYGPGGLGGFVRGIFVEGHLFRYETVDGQRQRFKKESEQRDQEKAAKLEAEVADRDRRWAALPDVYQQRKARFVENNKHWRRDYEEYELFVCEQAHLIATALKTQEAIVNFHKADWGEAVRLVSGLDSGHSGNTLGAACRLAIYEIELPEGVVRQHGAMSMVVGSKEHGDFSPEEQVANVLMEEE